MSGAIHVAGRSTLRAILRADAVAPERSADRVVASRPSPFGLCRLRRDGERPMVFVGALAARLLSPGARRAHAASTSPRVAHRLDLFLTEDAQVIAHLVGAVPRSNEALDDADVAAFRAEAIDGAPALQTFLSAYAPEILAPAPPSFWSGVASADELSDYGVLVAAARADYAALRASPLLIAGQPND